MSEHLKRQIASLRSLLARDPARNPDDAVVLCAALAQDTPSPLEFFVLKHVFTEWADLWETGPVRVEDFEALFPPVAAAALRLLDAIESENARTGTILGNLVSTHIHKLGVLRSGRNA